MIGPILSFELLRTSRRGWHHYLLWFYVAWLLSLVAVLWLLHVVGEFGRSLEVPPEVFARFCVAAVELLLGQQFVVLLLTAPVFAAGSIGDEKTRGTLQEWLTTDLSAWEIVRDKLLAQVVQLGVLSLAGLPLFAFFGVFAGMDLAALAALLATTVLQLVAYSAAGLLASVWCKRTPAAVLGAFLAAAAASAAAWMLGWEVYYWPMYLLAPVWLEPAPQEVVPRLIRAGLAWGGLAALCLGLAVWRLRPAYLHQLACEGLPSASWNDHVRRPPVGSQPLRWKERHLGELPALPLLRRLPRPLTMIGVALLTLAVGGSIIVAHKPPGISLLEIVAMVATFDIDRLAQVWAQTAPAGASFLALSLAVLTLFSMGVGIRCAGVVSSERERQTWDSLLTTPLEPRQILRGKLWGVIDSVSPYMLAYLIPAAATALAGGLLALFWVVFCWAATWMLMYYMGATGVRCSVRSLTSWRSLLATLLSNVWVLLMRYALLGAPIGLLITGLLVTFGQIVFFGTTAFGALFVQLFAVVSVMLTLLWLFGEAELQLNQAEQWLWQHERIPPLEARIVKH